MWGVSHREGDEALARAQSEGRVLGDGGSEPL